jgi:hypothetical protein
MLLSMILHPHLIREAHLLDSVKKQISATQSAFRAILQSTTSHPALKTNKRKVFHLELEETKQSFKITSKQLETQV